MDRPEKPDSTLQLVAGAALTAAYTAVPDYVESPRARRVARVALVALGAGAGLAVGWRSRDEEPPEAEEPDDVPPLSRTHVALLASVVPLGVVSHRATRGINEAVVELLQARGVRRPWTVVGLGWGVAAVGLELVQRRFPSGAAPADPASGGVA